MNKTKKFRSATDEEEAGAGEPFYVSMTELEDQDVYNIFIFKPITDAEQFIPAIQALQQADEGDLVIVNLSTPGGDIDATDTFLQALGATEAEVVYVASGGVHSAGTLILMQADADNVAFSKGFNALVHNGNVGMGSKYSDWVNAVAYMQVHMSKLMRDAYKGFLSETELEQLLQGKDYWFDGEEFKSRLYKRNALLKKD